jgi:hypothetical protein
MTRRLTLPNVKGKAEDELTSKSKGVNTDQDRAYSLKQSDYIPAILSANTSARMGFGFSFPVSMEQGRSRAACYVQEGDSAGWAVKIAGKMNGDARKYRIDADGRFASYPIIAELDSTHRSTHRRLKQLEPITIYHTFLKFF